MHWLICGSDKGGETKWLTDELVLASVAISYFHVLVCLFVVREANRMCARSCLWAHYVFFCCAFDIHNCSAVYLLVYLCVCPENPRRSLFMDVRGDNQSRYFLSRFLG